MTSSHDVDELASALLDGLLDPEAAEAARRDPAVAARAAEMQAAREAFRRVPPPDPDRRERAIAAALGALDALDVPPASAADPTAPAEAGTGAADPAATGAGGDLAGTAPAGAAAAAGAGGDPRGVLGADPHEVDQSLMPPAETAPAGPPDPAADGWAGAAPAPAADAASGWDQPARPLAAVPPDPGATGGLDAVPDAAPPPSAPAGPPSRPPASGPGPGPTGPAAGQQPAAPAGVVPLARRRRRWTDPRWLGAAAALILVLAIGAVVVGQSSDSSSDTSEAASEVTSSTPGPQSGESGDAGPDAAEGSGSAGPDAADGDTPAAVPDREGTDQEAPGSADSSLSADDESAGVVDFGNVGSPEALAGRAAAALDRGLGADRADGASAGSRCADPLDADDGPLVLRGRARLDGEPVEVWVHDDGRERRMAVTDAACDVVADGPLRD